MSIALPSFRIANMTSSTIAATPIALPSIHIADMTSSALVATHITLPSIHIAGMNSSPPIAPPSIHTADMKASPLVAIPIASATETQARAGDDAWRSKAPGDSAPACWLRIGPGAGAGSPLARTIVASITPPCKSRAPAHMALLAFKSQAFAAMMAFSESPPNSLNLMARHFPSAPGGWGRHHHPSESTSKASA